MRKPREFECEVINPIVDDTQQEEYDKKLCNTLATVLVRSLKTEEIDVIIKSLKEVQTCK